MSLGGVFVSVKYCEFPFHPPPLLLSLSSSLSLPPSVDLSPSLSLVFFHCFSCHSLSVFHSRSSFSFHFPHSPTPVLSFPRSSFSLSPFPNPTVVIFPLPHLRRVPRSHSIVARPRFFSDFLATALFFFISPGSIGITPPVSLSLSLFLALALSRARALSLALAFFVSRILSFFRLRLCVFSLLLPLSIVSPLSHSLMCDL